MFKGKIANNGFSKNFHLFINYLLNHIKNNLNLWKNSSFIKCKPPFAVINIKSIFLQKNKDDPYFVLSSIHVHLYGLPTHYIKKYLYTNI